MMGSKKERYSLLVFAILSMLALSAVWRDTRRTPVPELSITAFSEEDKLLDDVPMELTFEDQTIFWTVTNQTEEELSRGNGGWAQLQYLQDQTWHTIGIVKIGNVYVMVTAEAHTFPPGQQFSSYLDLQRYGGLADGDYRLVFPVDSFSRVRGKWELYGYAAQTFVIRDGLPQAS